MTAAAYAASLCVCSGAAAGVAVVVTEQLPQSQQWTLLSLLAVVLLSLLGGGKMLISGVVKAIQALGKDQREHTKVLADLLTEIKLQGQANAHSHKDYAEARERAVDEVKVAIQRIPDAVVRELERKRKSG